MSVESVAGASIAIQQSTTQQKLSTAMVKQQLDMQKQVLQIVQVAVDANKGQNVDTSA